MVLSQSADTRLISTFVEASVSASWTESAAIAASPSESLKIRTEMMLILRQHIVQQRWSLQETCRLLRLPSPRVQNLLNGEIGRFSAEDLIELLAKLGLTVQVAVVPTSAMSDRQSYSYKRVKNGPDETPVYY